MCWQKCITTNLFSFNAIFNSYTEKEFLSNSQKHQIITIRCQYPLTRDKKVHCPIWLPSQSISSYHHYCRESLFLVSIERLLNNHLQLVNSDTFEGVPLKMYFSDLKKVRFLIEVSRIYHASFVASNVSERFVMTFQRSKANFDLRKKYFARSSVRKLASKLSVIYHAIQWWQLFFHSSYIGLSSFTLCTPQGFQTNGVVCNTF